MKPIPVIACANSRLHADVMLIRLRHAGIECRKISALFPRNSVPNSVACWLRMDQELSMHCGQETITPAGSIRTALTQDSDAREMINLLATSGVGRRAARALEEKLEQGHTLIAVEAANEDEAAIAWHVFKHVSAEMIAVGSPKAKTPETQRPVSVLSWAAVAA